MELQPRHSQEQLHFVFIQHAKTPMTMLALVVMDIVTFLEGGLHPFLWRWAVLFLLLFFPWLSVVTSASFIGFQVVVLCSFVSLSTMLLLCSSELDLRIRISEYFF